MNIRYLAPLVFWGFMATAAAPSVRTPIELGAMGAVIVKVHLLGADGISREFRMVLDTGSSATMLDRSVPSSFWKAGGGEGIALGSHGETEAEPVRIHQIQVGPHFYKKIEGARIDLRPVTRMEDSPFDGIIGMDVLRAHRFRIDFQNRELIWGDGPDGHHLMSISKDEFGLPEVKLMVGGLKLKTLCDTGSNTFLTLPSEIKRRMRAKINDLQTGLSGGIGSAPPVPTMELAVDGVGAGTRVWCEANVVFTEGPTTTRLGRESLWPSVWFDLPNNRMGFSISPSGCLTSQPPIRSPLWVFWDRSSPVAELKVLAIKPGSPFESAGIKPGDVVMQIGNLKQGDLGIVSTREAVSRPGPVRMVIRRDGKQLEFEVPPSGSGK